MSNKNIKPHHLEPFLNHPNRELRYAAVESPGLSSEQIDKILDHEKDSGVLRSVLHEKNSKITDSHIRKILDGDYSHRVKERAAAHPNISNDTINKAIDIAAKDDEELMAANALSHPHVSSDNLFHALKSGSRKLESEVVWHSKATPEHWRHVVAHSQHPGNVAQAQHYLDVNR